MTKSIAALLFSFVSYYLAARLGLEIATINSQASPIWPATGLAIGFIILFGPKVSIGIFLGAFLSNYQTGLNLYATFAVAAGNTFEALFFFWAYRRFLVRDDVYGVYTRSILSIFIFVISASISATFGSMALWGSSIIAWETFPKNWITWWTGDFLGALFIVPLIYSLRSYKLNTLKKEFYQFLRFLPLLAATYALCFFIFSIDAGRPFLFSIFLCVLISSLYFPAAYLYLISILVAVFSVWQTVHNRGPFGGGGINDNLIHLQVFLSSLSLTCIGISTLKIEGFTYRPKMALLFGWILSGVTFYFSFNSMVSGDESILNTRINKSTQALESRMNDYIQMLESGVSFINASDFVTSSEWKLYSKKLLSTHHYPGIEGLGVIFSDSIKERFKNQARQISKYQPTGIVKSVENLPPELTVNDPEENFIITYVEPEIGNLPAIGLNISTEKHRYEAAIAARDTGRATITQEIRLIQDITTRPGFLLYAPIYHNVENLKTTQDRRAAFIGFVYSPVVFEKFMESVVPSFNEELDLMILSKSSTKTQVYSTPNWNQNFGTEYKSSILLAGQTFDAVWKKGTGVGLSISLISSWIGFFGTMTTLFLAIMLSSLQHVTVRAQTIASEMTKEVEERRRTWQALTEISPVGLYLTDADGSCTYVNPAWSRMSGLSLESAQGYGWLSAIHPEDQELVKNNWQSFVGGGIFACEYRFAKKDGSTVRVSGQAIAIRDDKQMVTGYFGTNLDITALYQNQMALITSSRLSSIGEMASGIAHEINNPLAIIQNKMYILEKILDDRTDNESEKLKIYVGQVASTVRRIAKIITGLQSFARETSGEPDELSSLQQVVDNTMELCRERFDSHSTVLQVPSPEELNLHFLGRPEQVSQVLLNLINNSFDATRNQIAPWVKISIKHTSERLLIAVSDSGPGIPASVQTKIFDPFFTTKEVGLGTGLGLSISKGIVERHRGQLYVDLSKANTTFVVDLPLTKTELLKVGT